VTFWALAEMVKAHSGPPGDGPCRGGGAKLAGAVAEAIAAHGEAQWVERHLRPLAGLTVEAELGGERRSEAFAAWRRFFEALAERYLLTGALQTIGGVTRRAAEERLHALERKDFV
jgi:hypothetical protein